MMRSLALTSIKGYQANMKNAHRHAKSPLFLAKCHCCNLNASSMYRKGSRNEVYGKPPA